MSITVEHWPLPRRDGKRKKLTRRYRAAAIKTENLPRRCRAASKNYYTATAPLPRRLLEKCCEFYDCDYSGLELLSLIHKIR
jgi:hypothetical protein